LKKTRTKYLVNIDLALKSIQAAVFQLADVIFINEYKRWQQTQRLALGGRWENSDRIFCDDFGKPIRPDYITIWFRKFIDRTGQPKIHIHSLRHTNATLQIAGGVPLRTVSSRLGHAQLSTTGNIYSHAIQSADEAAADVLQDILNPVKKHG